MRLTRMAFSRLILFFCLIAPLFAEQPDSLDRQRLVAHFEMTDSWLADEVSHLTPAQLAFRPSPGAWNVLDCVEHLVLSEREYWALFKTSMAARPTKGSSPSDDVDRIWYGIDRKQRQKTIESETPKASYAGIDPALRDFRSLRATMLTYAKTTNEDWRHHLIPQWDRDGYQWLLMISAHSQRHILQIREIKHSPGFPAS